ncbi:MAG: DNA alkylation repair protein [Clostridia bacterium]
MTNSIRKQLFELSEEGFKDFSQLLIPGGNSFIGVRMPDLRILAKKIANDDWREYLNSKPKYFEEIMLQGMAIGYAKADIDEILPLVKDFITKINNWAVCDCFCGGLKITKKHKNLMWEFIKPYLSSNKEFYIRFGVVMMLCYYIEPEYLERIFEALNKINSKDYYARMSSAWLISNCFIKFPEQTMHFLKNNKLDDKTYNKALQKITESRRIDDETKKWIRSLKRINVLKVK